jgi:tetratricopeptide (TPR) repeat protein
MLQRFIFFSGIILLAETGCSPLYKQLNESGYKKIQHEDYDGAMKDFEASVRENDSYWLSHVNRGASFAQMGRTADAIAEFNKSILLRARNPLAFDDRGMCRELEGDTAGAISDYKEAIRLNPKFDMAYAHLGLLLAKKNACSEAMQYLQTAMERKAFSECITQQLLSEKINSCTGK